ncbi:progestin and adipoQ receptor family member 3-like isoform X2 [Gigantopelta aegis]|uniref:progestin and adipoQ receptor family member 3-like isoform X2 n=1 Tax=Gigantopelta aegis TaxID=1735272 RepID=UPI001B889A20|nr:progestin and adipoQ receptor family member 3-like isoform X2 [Gigantopelta aegis]
MMSSEGGVVISGLDTVKNRLVSTGNQYADDAYHVLDLEIDRPLDSTCSTGLCDATVKDIPLFKYHEIPDFMQGNPFVVKGYRVFLPFSLCLKSLFVWSNETVNIWTHFGGFFIFLLITLYDNLIVIPRYNGTLADHMIVTIGLLCYQFCMLCSTGFHIFCCHSERASKRWLAVDLTGISIGIIGCYLPAVHYAFYCLSLHPRFFTHRWFHIRMLLYCSLVGYGLIPTAHWIYLNGGWSSRIVQIFVPKVTTMYLLGMLAFAFYITKFPERMFPGTFDFLGSSHQCWHVIIVIAFAWWTKAGEEIMLFRTSNQCHE